MFLYKHRKSHQLFKEIKIAYRQQLIELRNGIFLQLVWQPYLRILLSAGKLRQKRSYFFRALVHSRRRDEKFPLQKVLAAHPIALQLVYKHF